MVLLFKEVFSVERRVFPFIGRDDVTVGGDKDNLAASEGQGAESGAQGSRLHSPRTSADEERFVASFAHEKALRFNLRVVGQVENCLAF